MAREARSDTVCRNEKLEFDFRAELMDMISMCVEHRCVVMGRVSFNESVHERTNIVGPVSIVLEIHLVKVLPSKTGMLEGSQGLYSQYLLKTLDGLEQIRYLFVKL